MALAEGDMGKDALRRSLMDNTTLSECRDLCKEFQADKVGKGYSTYIAE
jgi:hypothetical protein